MVVCDYDVKYNQEKNKYEATTVVYRWSKEDVSIGDIINPDDTSKFTKDASTLGKNNYLKHVLNKDNKVTESYVCVILKDKEYCLRGGKDNNGNSFYGYSENENDYTENVLILKQIEDAKIEENHGCVFSAGDSTCSSSSLFVSANANGGVGVFFDNYTCYVDVDGSSFCESW